MEEDGFKMHRHQDTDVWKQDKAKQGQGHADTDSDDEIFFDAVDIVERPDIVALDERRSQNETQEETNEGRGHAIVDSDEYPQDVTVSERTLISASGESEHEVILRKGDFLVGLDGKDVAVAVTANCGKPEMTYLLTVMDNPQNKTNARAQTTQYDTDSTLHVRNTTVNEFVSDEQQEYASFVNMNRNDTVKEGDFSQKREQITASGKTSLTDEMENKICKEEDPIKVLIKLTNEANTYRGSLDGKSQSYNAASERQPLEDKLCQLLKYLHLHDKYPEKITRSDMYTITKSSLSAMKPRCHGDLAKYFLEKIVQFDYRARDLRTDVDTNTNTSLSHASLIDKFERKGRQIQETNQDTEIHPLDILVAVFLCCDNIARQDLAYHLWSCRLAIPFVVQTSSSELPSCFMWPLRGLVMRWESTIGGQNNVREGRLLKETMAAVAFIRFGDIPISKSCLINDVISNSEKAHSIFMHRNSPGSVRRRLLVNGMIDIGWYFPTSQTISKQGSLFQDAVMFLNLHGDASECHMRNQVKFLSSVAKVFVIVASANTFGKNKESLKSVLEDNVALLLVITDKQISVEDNSVLRDLFQYVDQYRDRIEFILCDKENKVLIIEEIRLEIKKFGKETTSRLEEILYLNACVNIDERNAEVIKMRKIADSICDTVLRIPLEQRRNVYVPLQGEPWKTWAQADKEKLRLTSKRQNEDAQEYMAERERVMQQCRLKQVEIIKQNGTESLINTFVESLDVKSDDERMILLRFLKFRLDDTSRDELGRVYCRYEEIMKMLSVAMDEQKEELKIQLDNLDKKMASLSFGLEHLLREMGQLFEAHTYLGKEFKYQDLLPTLAAKVVLGGVPFEILDGTVNSVPSTWVKAVLLSVRDILVGKRKTQNVRIKAIAALGIQSSGKSTMLNALFGCQYAVSAGRCTRGAYCQFIEVEESLANEIGIDYVLAIDTEGLRAPEFSSFSQMITHDNELSTFVIGLADMSILNLMGENTTYLDEILPISVHAFLRMQMASKVKPRCIVVHQNVKKEDNHKLLQQGKALEEKLNKQAKVACSIEGTETKTFREVIQFDVSEDVFYISSFCEGIQPMAPVSPIYSQELTELKTKLLLKMDGVEPKLLDSFVAHLENLWSCIKRDDFVYQFRNTIETEARNKLDNFWCDADWKFRQPIDDMLSNCFTEIQNCSRAENLSDLRKSKESQIKMAMKDNWQRQVSEFQEFIQTSDSIMKDAMQKWQREMQKRFDDLLVHKEMEVSIYLLEFCEVKLRELALRNEMVRYKDNMRKEIELSIKKLKCASTTRRLSEQDISQLFETKWQNWKFEALKNNPRSKATVNFNNEAYESVRNAFPNETETLHYCIRKKTIDQYDYIDFDSSKFLSRFQKLTNFLWKERDALENAVAILFQEIDESLVSRGRIIRPYAKKDIDSVVMKTKKYFAHQYQGIASRDQVMIAVIVCGHSIKRLQKFHLDYEHQVHPDVLIESEREHYLRVFQAHYSEAETLKLLADDFQEIITRGVLEKISRTLPGKIVIDMRSKYIEFNSKFMVLHGIMLEGAGRKQFEDLFHFAKKPSQSIELYIRRLIERYAGSKDKNFKKLFETLLQRNKADIASGLTRCNQARSINEWLQTVKTSMQSVIVMKDIDRLTEVCQGQEVNMQLLFEKLSNALDVAVKKLVNEKKTFLERNADQIMDQIVFDVLKTVVGCTESCPFCGAICMVAHQNHEGDHFTTLHRPQGCNQWHYEDTKVLVTETCPVNVSSNKSFVYWKKEKKCYCPFKDYRNIYPNWHITIDETGEDTSFWNWFFAEHVNQLAGKDYKAPDIPASWRALSRKTEIRKLRDKMKK